MHEAIYTMKHISACLQYEAHVFSHVLSSTSKVIRIYGWDKQQHLPDMGTCARLPLCLCASRGCATRVQGKKIDHFFTCWVARWKSKTLPEKGNRKWFGFGFGLFCGLFECSCSDLCYSDVPKLPKPHAHQGERKPEWQNMFPAGSFCPWKGHFTTDLVVMQHREKQPWKRVHSELTLPSQMPSLTSIASWSKPLWPAQTTILVQIFCLLCDQNYGFKCYRLRKCQMRNVQELSSMGKSRWGGGE